MIPHDFQDNVWKKVKHSWWRIIGEFFAAILFAIMFYIIVVFAFSL